MDFFSKCDQISSFLRIWSHLLKKSLTETSFFVQRNLIDLLLIKQMINSKCSWKSEAVANLSSAKVIVAWMSRNSQLETGRISAKCGCSQKRVREMIRRYRKKLPIDKYSQHRSILWPVWTVWLNGWVFIYKLSGCGLLHWL